MNKSFKIAKMNLNDMIKPVAIFYVVLISVLVLLISPIMLNFNVSGNMSGIELSTMIFIFVCGLNSFKENFYFSQGSNISRKSFLNGVVLSSLPVAAVMAFIDTIINKMVNLVAAVPSIYDMIYQGGADVRMINSGWVQSNSIMTFLGTFILLFVLYCFAYTVGIVISMIYFRCSTLMKVLVSIIPILLINLWAALDSVNKYFFYDFNKFIRYIFGVSSHNVYLGVLGFAVLLAMLYGGARLLIKDACVKEK